MRLIKYLKGHLAAVVAVFALLVVLAYCDLALPDYTSQIVDTGIQQSGVEDVATEALTARTHDAIAMLLSEEDEAVFQASYDEQADGTYRLNDEGLANRSQLDDMMAFPMVLVAYSDQVEGMDLDAALMMYGTGLIGKDKIAESLEEAKAQMEDAGMTGTLLDQQALAAAQSEYESLGYDMTDIQMSYLKRVGLTMLGIAALSMVINIVVSFLASRVGAQIARDLRSRVYTKVLSFSDAEVDSFSTASLITRCTNDIQLVQMVEVMALRMVLYSPILAVGGIIMVAKTNISMSWVIALAVVAIFLVIGVLMAVAMPKFKLMQKLVDKVNLVSREILTGLPVIRAFGREGHEEERFAQANGELMRTQLFTNRAMAFMMPIMQLVMNLTSVLIVWVGAHYVDQGTIQTGDLIAFITYSMLVVMSFLIIGMISILLPRANVAAGRIDEVLATQASIVDAQDAAQADARLPKEGGARVEFDDVCFAYGTDSGDVLEHVSFVAEPGKTLAIIGATGSGKSTVVKLMERFYDVRSGRVLVDGIDVRDLSQDALRATFGYVPQKSFLFSGTVDSNVSFADADMDEGRKELALSVAQASDFVAEREGGMESEIAQGGSNVSGGQRQRLAIARALASDARAYLFDDSFSALDYKTDAKLRAELADKLAGKTVVIVAQRIATIMQADTIVVLDEGRVVGRGTHAELLRTCPEYLEIAKSQLSDEELAKGGER